MSSAFSIENSFFDNSDVHTYYKIKGVNDEDSLYIS